MSNYVSFLDRIENPAGPVSITEVRARGFAFRLSLGYVVRSSLIVEFMAELNKMPSGFQMEFDFGSLVESQDTGGYFLSLWPRNISHGAFGPIVQHTFWNAKRFGFYYRAGAFVLYAPNKKVGETVFYRTNLGDDRPVLRRIVEVNPRRVPQVAFQLGVGGAYYLKHHSLTLQGVFRYHPMILAEGTFETFNTTQNQTARYVLKGSWVGLELGWQFGYNPNRALLRPPVKSRFFDANARPVAPHFEGG